MYVWMIKRNISISLTILLNYYFSIVCFLLKFKKNILMTSIVLSIKCVNNLNGRKALLLLGKPIKKPEPLDMHEALSNIPISAYSPYTYNKSK